MPEDLGARVLREGLVSRDQLADALAEGATGGVLASALLHHGLKEEALHALLRREGFSEATAEMLQAGAGPVSRLLHGRMAHALQALPVEDRGHEVVVAMIDPSDAHALRELRFTLGRMVRAVVAPAGDLRRALASAYPGDIPPEPQETPLALIRRRAPDGTPTAAPSDPLMAAKYRRRTRPMAAAPAAEPTPAPQPAAAAEPTPSPEPASPEPPARPRSIIPRSEASWGDMEDAGPASPLPRPEAPRLTGPPAIGPTLASLRGASDRDEIVRLVCDGIASVAKTVVFLALRRGVLRGWEARGSQVSADAIRNLWIPATSPSMFRNVIERGEVYRGPYGTTAADDLFRAATGSRGGRVLVHPVRVAGKPLGAICAEGVRYGESGPRRVEELALAAGRAFERLLAS